MIIGRTVNSGKLRILFVAKECKKKKVEIGVRRCSDVAKFAYVVRQLVRQLGLSSLCIFGC